jgi:hypothetical protein
VAGFIIAGKNGIRKPRFVLRNGGLPPFNGLPTRVSNDVEEVLIKKAHELIEKAGR